MVSSATFDAIESRSAARLTAIVYVVSSLWLAATGLRCSAEWSRIG
jgi:hypothetical protein